MEHLYLIDAEEANEGIKLKLYNPIGKTLEEVLDTKYKPYFYIPFPLSKADKETVHEVNAKICVVEKKDLFTDQTKKVGRVEIERPSDLKWISKRFEKTWEDEVSYTSGYIYDHDLTFSAQHDTDINLGIVRHTYTVPEDSMKRFQERFLKIKRKDLAKYALLERWFNLLSQPIPEIPPKKLGINEKVERERYSLAIMLSRLANIPVQEAYYGSKVSRWIKSIFYDHFRRHSILIPTSNELRRGETKSSVKGALTFAPKPGIYFNTVVVDFESLYPSIIDAYNLSYETINCFHKSCSIKKVPELEHHVCQVRRGVYSALIGSIKDLRIHWFKPLSRDPSIPKDTRNLARIISSLLKLILVSSYGVTIRIHGLARPSLAESITAYGRYSLKTTWNTAEKNGLHPIYGDTDSLFLNDPKDTQVKWLIKTVKERLNLDLMVAEKYSVCILPRAMKSYFGIRQDGTPDIKGLTAIKSNSPRFIQKVFERCVLEMVDVKNQADFEEAKRRIQRRSGEAVRDLEQGRISLKDLEHSVRLHDEPSEKREAESIHQPYQCALQLIDSGDIVKKGDVVKFIKVNPFVYKGRNFTVKPSYYVKSFREVNVGDYIRNLRTALKQTFRPMGIDFRDREEGGVTLSDFV